MFEGKRVLVLGLGKSGKAAIRLLDHFGASIVINDGHQAEEIPEYEEYVKKGYDCRFGGQDPALFEEDFDFCVKVPGINYHAPFVLRLKERGIPVITEIELAYQVAKPQHYIAVTGTNGKTTTVSLIYAILKGVKENVHICGNYGIPYCDVVMDHALYENEGHTIVLEMSNFQLLDIKDFHAQVSTVTNLTPDHLDYMDSLDEYYASKMRIYENSDEHDVFIRNLDDDTLTSYLKRFPPKAKIETFSVSQEADCMLKDQTIYYKGEKVIDRKDIKIVGMHNVANIMVAILACVHSGVALSDIAKGISAFKGVEHRLEFVRELHGVKYYNDSKGTNTDAAVIAIKAFEKPVILLMGGHEKNLDVSDVAKYNDHIKTLITFGEAGTRFARDMHHPHTYTLPHMKEAVLKAHEIAKDGDVVLLSPSTSSFDEFHNMAERGNMFKEIVNHFE